MESKFGKNTSNLPWLTISWLGNFVAIKALLQQQLAAAIPWSNPNLPGLTSEKIPLYRLPDNRGVLYRSAIAFQLAPLLPLSAIEIAHPLTTALLSRCQDNTRQLGLDFNVEVVSPGWIDFRLSDPGLATWLQRLINIPLSLSNPENHLLSELQARGGVGDRGRMIKHQESENLFPLQYVHARCCSLLGLANRQGLIQVRDLGCQNRGTGEIGEENSMGSQWQIVEPNPIPWLNEDLETAGEPLRLRLLHLAEWALITQMLDLLDASNHGDQRNWIKRGMALSQTFEEFYRNCRIWGEVRSQNPQLAQVRLGLVGITQILLRSLLHQFGLSAPVEL